MIRLSVESEFPHLLIGRYRAVAITLLVKQHPEVERRHSITEGNPLAKGPPRNSREMPILNSRHPEVKHRFGIGLDPDGTLLIAEYDNSRLQRFTPEGDLLDGWGGPGSGDGQFANAMDAAVDAAGRVPCGNPPHNGIKGAVFHG